MSHHALVNLDEHWPSNYRSPQAVVLDDLNAHSTKCFVMYYSYLKMFYLNITTDEFSMLVSASLLTEFLFPKDLIKKICSQSISRESLFQKLLDHYESFKVPYNRLHKIFVEPKQSRFKMELFGSIVNTPAYKNLYREAISLFISGVVALCQVGYHESDQFIAKLDAELSSTPLSESIFLYRFPTFDHLFRSQFLPHISKSISYQVCLSLHTQFYNTIFQQHCRLFARILLGSHQPDLAILKIILGTMRTFNTMSWPELAESYPVEWRHLLSAVTELSQMGPEDPLARIICPPPRHQNPIRTERYVNIAHLVKYLRVTMGDFRCANLPIPGEISVRPLMIVDTFVAKLKTLRLYESRLFHLNPNDDRDFKINITQFIDYPGMVSFALELIQSLADQLAEMERNRNPSPSLNPNLILNLNPSSSSSGGSEPSTSSSNP